MHNEDQVEPVNENFIKPSGHIDDYEKLNRIGEGAYGVVYRAKSRKTGKICAIKRIKAIESNDLGFPLYSLREISLLINLNHRNVVRFLEILKGSSYDQVFMAMEYCEQDLGSLLDYLDHPFDSSEIKCLMKQILEGIMYFHDQNIIHRDLKLSNLLLTSNGVLKIADLGLARSYFNGEEDLTPGVVTLWYRAPELLFGGKKYDSSIDMWSIGCILGELLCHKPFMPGSTQLEQLDIIVNTIGSLSPLELKYYSKFPLSSSIKLPTKIFNNITSILPYISIESLSLLNSLLVYIPQRRISAKSALIHKYFDEIPKAIKPDQFPRFPEIRNKTYEATIKPSHCKEVYGGVDKNNTIKPGLESFGHDKPTEDQKTCYTFQEKSQSKHSTRSNKGYNYEFDIGMLVGTDKFIKPNKRSKKNLK